jgi:hypothetical protein
MYTGGVLKANRNELLKDAKMKKVVKMTGQHLIPTENYRQVEGQKDLGVESI